MAVLRQEQFLGQSRIDVPHLRAIESGVAADFDVALALLAEQPERFRRLITHRFPLAEITQGFATAADKRSGSIKVAIQC